MIVVLSLVVIVPLYAIETESREFIGCCNESGLSYHYYFAFDNDNVTRFTLDEISDLFGEDYLKYIAERFENFINSSDAFEVPFMRTPHWNPYTNPNGTPGVYCRASRVIEFGPYGVASGHDVCRFHPNCIVFWSRRYWSVVCGDCGFFFRFRHEESEAHGTWRSM